MTIEPSRRCARGGAADVPLRCPNSKGVAWVVVMQRERLPTTETCEKRQDGQGFDQPASLVHSPPSGDAADTTQYAHGHRRCVAIGIAMFLRVIVTRVPNRLFGSTGLHSPEKTV